MRLLLCSALVLDAGLGASLAPVQAQTYPSYQSTSGGPVPAAVILCPGTGSNAGTCTFGGGGGGGSVTQGAGSSSNPWYIEGLGTAGTPAGGVFSVQGVSGGTPESVSGTVTTSPSGTQSVTGTITTTPSGTQTVQGPIIGGVLDVQAQPYAPAACTASAVTTGGTATTFISGPINGGWIGNPLAASDQNITTAEVAYVNVVTTATANGRGTNDALQPGQIEYLPPLKSGQSVSVIAATSSHAFSCRTF